MDAKISHGKPRVIQVNDNACVSLSNVHVQDSLYFHVLEIYRLFILPLDR